jgi:predicted transcriptional regulator
MPAAPKLSKLEMQIMDVLWSRGACCIRDVLDAFPAAKKPAYTTIQTTVYRLEAKKALRQARKVGNVHVFEPVIARSAAQRRLVDEFLGLFGGRAQPLMTHLIESGRLTLEDFKEAEKTFRKLSRKDTAR